MAHQPSVIMQQKKQDLKTDVGQIKQMIKDVGTRITDEEKEHARIIKILKAELAGYEKDLIKAESKLKEVK